MKTSILTRLLLLLIISYLPIACIIFWNNQQQREQAQRVVQEHSLQQARDIAFFHRQQIQEITNILLLLSKTTMIQDWDMELCNQSAGDFVGDFPNWFGFGVFDEQGVVQCSTLPESIGMSFADRPYVRTPLDRGEVAVSDYRLGTITGRYTFVVVAPIVNDDGTIRGAISIGIEPDAQSELIAQEVLHPDYHMTVIDQTNTILLRHPDPEQWIGTPYNQDLVNQIAGQGEGTFEGVDLEDNTRLYGFTRIEPTDATVLVSIDKALAFAEVNRIQQRNLILMAGTFIITALLIALAARLIARPLHQFSAATQQFARGDLSKRIDTNSGVLEIMQIQQAFNDMAQSIEARIEGRTATLQEVNQQLAEEIKTRKEVEAELANYTLRLRESNEDLEQFASVASHDLREPLRKISAFSERLQKSNLAEEQRQDYLHRLQDASQRMTLMIDNLLLYSRVEQKHNTQTEVDLTAVVHKAIADLDPLIKDTEGSVHTATLPTIQADLMQMQRLFQNLITNALKYHRDGVPPTVQITAQEDEQGIHIRVQDNGVGIPEKDSERIFKIFERLHGRNDGGGSGLGLAICRKIVLHHGGTITVESTVGAGSTFILSFPHAIKVTAENEDTE
jgi:signal transduction histidine kinase